MRIIGLSMQEQELIKNDLELTGIMAFSDSMSRDKWVPLSLGIAQAPRMLIQL